MYDMLYILHCCFQQRDILRIMASISASTQTAAGVKGNILDFNEDGKVNMVDITSWSLIVIFSIVFISTTGVFSHHLFLVLSGDEDLEAIAQYSYPLTSLCGTLVTLVYGLSFLDASGLSDSFSEEKPRLKFFDFDMDGKFDKVDLLCVFAGGIHAVVLVADAWLWVHGAVSTEQVVDLISASTRLILLFLAESYAAHENGSGKKRSGWRFLFDINHDGVFQFVDLLALICNSIYISALAISWSSLLWQPFGKGEVWVMVQLTGQVNFLLVGGIAAVYLSKKPVSRSTEQVLCAFSLLFLVLLLRTLAEMYWQSVNFAGVTRLGNGMVLGVTQLVMGTIVVQRKAVKNSSKSA